MHATCQCNYIRQAAFICLFLFFNIRMVVIQKIHVPLLYIQQLQT